MKYRSGYKSEFENLGSVIKKLIKNIRPEKDSDLDNICRIWDQAMPGNMVEYTQPAAIKGDILIVHVMSSGFIQQLNFIKADIISQVNQLLGANVVSEIKFKIGNI